MTVSDMSNPLKGLHDKLLEEMPDGASHASDNCPLCAQESIDDQGANLDDLSEGGSMSDKTFTQDELNAAVQAAVQEAVAKANADNETKLAELQGQTEIDKAVAAAKAETTDEIAELQSKLDAAVLEASAAKTELENFKASVEAEKVAAEEAAALEARTTERLGRVSEFNFPDEYVTANTDRWVAMADDEFEKVVADWTTVIGAAKTDTTIPATTAMTASRESAGDNNTGESVLATIMELRQTGTDPRTL